MTIEIHAKTRDGNAYADGIYTKDATIVLAGGRIRNHLSKSVSRGLSVRKYMDDPLYVSSDGVILKDCVFDSPSIAALFVTGNISNGYRVWKVKDGATLGQFLVKNGLK